MDDSIHEDMTIALMLDFPGIRDFYLKHTSVADYRCRFNRIVFDAMQKMTGTVNICTVYDQIVAEKMAATGIAEHLAWLSALPWKTLDDPFPIKEIACTASR